MPILTVFPRFLSGPLAAFACSGLLVFSAPASAQTTSAQIAAHSVPDTLAQRVMACTLCHGQEGRATNAGYFPRIAGKPAGYLYNQLRNFREGRRQNPGMSQLLDPLSDAYLRDIAQYFASLDLPYPPPQTANAPAAELARGEALIRQGDAQRQIPACVQCHGDALTGRNPAIPGLIGLPRDYLIGQLGAWQTGQRHAGAPDCMARIAQALSAQDVGALATWLSAQAVPTQAHAVAASPQALPMDCGSGLP
ncbi:cytochrome c [Hydrogenophaga sp.]|uniref:c-type cytochrome n=1 Tax=Hydrogenophaga sp. TaxID=1904254 RepID=UPI0035689DAB